MVPYGARWGWVLSISDPPAFRLQRVQIQSALRAPDCGQGFIGQPDRLARLPT